MFRKLLKVLFPEKCKSCGKIGIALCQRCLNKIPIAEDPENKKIFAVFDYGNTVVQKSIKDLKYYRRAEVIDVLIDSAVPYIGEFVWSELQGIHTDKLILVPIPEYKSKVSWRGFNQSEYIAKKISSKLENSTVENILTKKVNTLPQAKLRKAQRLRNVANTIVSKSADPKSLYIIVDDVTTTGATFLEAMRAMKASGAKKVLCVAITHGYARK